MLIASYLSWAFLLHPVRMFLIKHLKIKLNSIFPSIFVFAFFTTVHSAISFYFYNKETVQLGFFVSSILLLNWALITYFLLDRFNIRLYKPTILYKSPFYLIKYVVWGFIVSGAAIYICSGWVELLGLILVWFVYGKICAEISIKNLMRKMNWDREMAIYALVEEKNGMQLFGKQKKYPFP